MLRLDIPQARLRSAAMIEGLSFLLLLLIAMPLKYFAGMPMAVRIAGSIHGALFVWLMSETALAMASRGKTRPWGLRVFLASLIPAGTFYLDPELRADERLARASLD